MNLKQAKQTIAWQADGIDERDRVISGLREKLAKATDELARCKAELNDELPPIPHHANMLMKALDAAGLVLVPKVDDRTFAEAAIGSLRELRDDLMAGKPITVHKWSRGKDGKLRQTVATLKPKAKGGRKR